MKNFLIMSIPIFFKQYLLRDPDGQLSYMGKRVLDILNTLEFKKGKLGYRDTIFTIIPKMEDSILIDGFFSFIYAKTNTVSNLSLYSQELGISDSSDNEVFEAIIKDDNNDNIELKLLLDHYNAETGELMFIVI